VHEAPLGPLCRNDGTPLDVQPLVRMIGPKALSRSQVKAQLAEQRGCASKVGKLMDRMFLTFRRNRLQRREPRQYHPTRAWQNKDTNDSTNSFPTDSTNHKSPGGLTSRITTLADLSNNTEERYSAPYKSSSEEDNDSDYGHESRSKSTQDLRRSGRKNGEGSSLSALSSRQYRLAKRIERKREGTGPDDREEELDYDFADTDEENTADMYESEGVSERIARRKTTKKNNPRGSHPPRPTGRGRAKSSSSYADTDLDAGETAKIKQKSPIFSRYVVPLGTEIDREWLQVDRQHDHQYCPQIGDRVVYFPQGHSALLSEFPARDRLLPWNSFNDRWPVVECQVRHISFDFPPTAELRRCSSVVAAITLVILRAPDKWKLHPSTGYMQVDLIKPRVTRHRENAEQTFTVNIRNWDEVPDFVVPYHMFARAMKAPWRAGMEITADYKASDAEIEINGEPMVQYRGKVVTLSSSTSEWPHSPWEALEVLWDTGVYNPNPMQYHITQLITV
jgi:hypothetical protein